MIKCVWPAACALALCVIPTGAAAQTTTPLGGRLIVSINAAGQPGTDNLTSSRSFEAYPGLEGPGETATVVTEQEIKTGNRLIDFGAAYRVNGPFGVGVAFTSFSTARGATMQGSLPHPLLFNQHRAFTLSIPELEHKQRAVHLQAVAFIPFIENVDFMVSAGPTFFTVTQGFATFSDFSEVGLPFTDVNITHTVSTRKESTVGFNVGADAMYSITRMIGLGGMVRYTRGTVDFNIADGQTVSLKAGNVQAGAGLRIRF